MSNYFVLAIRKPFLDELIEGRKKFEIRTRIPSNLRKGDWLFLVQTATHGQIMSAAHVKRIYTDNPATLWDKHHQDLGVTLQQYTDYTKGHDTVNLIEFDRITDVRSKPDNITKLGLKRTPQWFIQIDMMQFFKFPKRHRK